jgi:hypothetical protein
VLLADRDDLAGLPAAVAAWGRERVAVGVTLRWDADADGTGDVVVVAPWRFSGWVNTVSILPNPPSAFA